jgi:hypothetical protein
VRRIAADVASMQARGFLIVLVVGLLSAACAPPYDASLLASIEGRWLCDVQRYTFDTQADIQVELDRRLEGNGVSAEQYRAFKDDLTKDRDLRGMVKAAFEQRCNP